MKIRNSTAILFLIITLLSISIISCNKGLQEVEGFSGKIFLPEDSTGAVMPFPDSLKAAVIVVAPYGFYTSVDSFLTRILSFSDPLDTARPYNDYFIQTLPGVYMAGVVGIKVPVTDLLFMPSDSISRHPEYFVPLGIYAKPGFAISGIEVWEDEITEDVNITMDYSFELPFGK